MAATREPGKPGKDEKEATREPYYRLQWKQDIDFLDTDGAHSLYHSDFHSPAGAAYLGEVYNFHTRLETVTVLYICGVLEMFRQDGLPTGPSLKWFHGFCNCMCHVKVEATAGRMRLCERNATSLNFQQREQRVTQLLSELPEDFPQLEFNAIIYKNMADIFNGRVAGIDLAVKAEVLARVYADGPIHDVARKSLSSVVDILAHKNPTMRVLEVGAGTGSCTSIALDVLIVDDRDMPGHHAKRYHDYAFTDISPAFFEKAEELFARDWTKFPSMVLADGGSILSKASIDGIFKPQAIGSSDLQELLTGPLRASLRSTVDMDAGRIEMALGGPLYMDDIPGKCSAGTLQWAGRPNLFWWIDRVKGVAAATFTPVISQADARFEELTSEFKWRYMQSSLKWV